MGSGGLGQAVEVLAIAAVREEATAGDRGRRWPGDRGLDYERPGPKRRPRTWEPVAASRSQAALESLAFSRLRLCYTH
jgi:hypothetical protein